MPASSSGVAVLAEWVAKAENDMVSAIQISKLGANAPTDTLCFHAQQCVDRYLKALLVLQGTRVPKIRDLTALVKLLHEPLRPSVPVSELTQLTMYAVLTRYPGAEDVSRTLAVKFLGMARRIRRDARRLLPEESWVRHKSRET